MSVKSEAIKVITDYKKNLFSHKFLCSSVEEKQYNFEITVTKNNVKNKLQVYFGKKGIKTVIQGSSSSDEYSEIEGLVTGKQNFESSKKKEIEYDEYIGTDETGKGDYFGPLVIAGFYVDKDIQSFLSDLGVRDSKELSDPQINRMAEAIRKEYPDNYSILSIEPEKYNQLYAKIKNLNKLLNWGHSKVIESIWKKHQPQNVIVDQFSKTPVDISLTKEFSDTNFVQIPKAEKYIGVAAASILARNEMNKWFDRINSQGFTIYKGASGQVERAAREIYSQSNSEALSKLVKLHFKTTQKIFDH